MTLPSAAALAERRHELDHAVLRGAAEGFPEDAANELAFERLLTSLITRLVNAAPDSVDEIIVDCQRRIVEALDLDRSTLWQISPDGHGVCTHSWTRPEFPVVPHEAAASDYVHWLLSRIPLGEPVWFNSVAEVPRAADHQSLVHFGTGSKLIVPMKSGTEVTGALAFATILRERVWHELIVGRIQLVAAVLGQALLQKRSQEQLQQTLSEAHRLRDRLVVEDTDLRGGVKIAKGPHTIVAESASAKRAVAQMRSVASTHATVLLLGETGTGKEVFAQAIHDMSPRHQRPMVRVNCAAIPAALVESELFGRERGAYTGALSRQVGRFELAEGSTIFLDEIGELPLDAQVKLLRVLQEKVVERLGSPHPIKLDVRIIAATSRDLERAVQEQKFREDLLYRLNVFPIVVPPLRERAEDIPVLLWTFIDEYCRAFGKRIHSVQKESLAALQRHQWRGNVRELRNLVERAVIVATGPQLTIEVPTAVPTTDPQSARLTDVEARHIRDVLKRVGWRVRGTGGAAEVLGVKPSTLESRMAKLGIRRARKSADSEIPPAGLASC